jgi:hypothetical protein
MSYFMVDVEADGPIPGRYSMVSFGAIVVESGLQRTFHGRLRPISDQFLPEALAVSKLSREETLAFPNAVDVMHDFEQWIADNTAGRPIFISDNNGFDWQFINWYFHRYLKRNPFGFSSQNLGSLYKGLVKDTFATFKHLRETRHTHDPGDDARRNAEGTPTRVVSMPCWELFDQQPRAYRDAVLPPSVRARVSIEAASPFGWERYVGREGAILGANRFCASAPGPIVMREFGFTREHIVETAKALLKRRVEADIPYQ